MYEERKLDTAGYDDLSIFLSIYLGVFWSLHLVYEERKLDTAGYDDLRFLANLLSRLAADLRLLHF